jgi:uncharacterized protein
MRKVILNRAISLHLHDGRSAFLWGPRRTGKSYLIRENFPDAILIDLLKTDVFAEYASRPALLRERHGNTDKLIIIDEVQTAPDLLNEVHWLIENRGSQFLLTGSSARKLRKGHTNLLAGRAMRHTLCPLTYKEVSGFDLEQIMVSGLLPPHFLSRDPVLDLRAYVGDYLKQEIAAEAEVRSIPSFAEFLYVAALHSGELINYTNISRESGVSAKTVRAYIEILEDTMLGFRLPPWRKAKRHRLIETEKFYLFDVGIANFLARRTPRAGTPEFGNSFEQYILMELFAYRAYRDPEIHIAYWRTSTGFEVDFIVNNMELAIEVKSAPRIGAHHLRGLRALQAEFHPKRCFLICLEPEARQTDDGIEILPWNQFLEALWAGDLLS